MEVEPIWGPPKKPQVLPSGKLLSSLWVESFNYPDLISIR